MASKDRVLSEVQGLADGSLDGIGDESLVAPLAVLTGGAVEHHEAVDRIWNEPRTKKGAARDLDLHDSHLGVEAD